MESTLVLAHDGEIQEEEYREEVPFHVLPVLSCLREVREFFGRGENRWCQWVRFNKNEDGTTCFSLVGAIRFFAPSEGLRSYVYGALDLGESWDNPDLVWWWNDSHGRTYQQVITLLDRAIETNAECLWKC